MTDRVEGVWVRNDSSVGLGSGGVSFGVTGWETKPVPLISVVAWRGDVSVRAGLSLGDHVEVAGERWRLVELRSPRGGQVSARLVPGGADEPLVSDVFEPVEFEAFGAVDAARVAELEAAIGRELPAVYRSWLVATNGARAAVPCGLEGQYFVLDQASPLFGIHPEEAAYDLEAAQWRYRDDYFTTNHIVIATPGGEGGLLTVSTGGSAPYDSIGYLPSDRMAGEMDPVERESLLVPAGADIHEFLGVLTPYELPRYAQQ